MKIIASLILMTWLARLVRPSLNIIYLLCLIGIHRPSLIVAVVKGSIKTLP